ncbi:membrane protein insertion efficiency factor YidD [Candidatus Uhrbacteria bacterium]|nr:membrane protein insertion efficiency factor YidD [Candidatus Uhrbacteria bacterium]
MNIFHLPRRLGQMSIRIYQKTLSPDHGPFQDLFPYRVCKFHPTCSQYTYEAIGKYGLIKGSWIGWKRILRCNPWSHGGIDNVA